MASLSFGNELQNWGYNGVKISPDALPTAIQMAYFNHVSAPNWIMR